MKKKENKDEINIKLEIAKLAIFAVCAILIFKFVIICGTVPTNSMNPTIKNGDFIVSNGLAYIMKSPERGDIVVFYSKELSKTLVKRIIGLEGDTVEFVDGYVLINGMVVEEDYIDDDVETNSSEMFIVPEGCYFMLGDNRENSYDCRSFENPYISKSDIKGKLIINISFKELFSNLF